MRDPVLGAAWPASVRRLMMRPAFGVTVVATCAIAIAALATVAAMMSALVLRPLPYANAAKLVVVNDDRTARKVQGYPFSDATFVDMARGATTSFAEFTAIQVADGILPAVDGTREGVSIAAVSANIFRVLGVSMAVGPGFDVPEPEALLSAAAASTPAPGAQSAVLSYEYWQRRYGGGSWGWFDISARCRWQNRAAISCISSMATEATAGRSAGRSARRNAIQKCSSMLFERNCPRSAGCWW